MDKDSTVDDALDDAISLGYKICDVLHGTNVFVCFVALMHAAIYIAKKNNRYADLEEALDIAKQQIIYTRNKPESNVVQ